MEKSDDEELGKESWLQKLEITVAKLKHKVQSNRNSAIIDKIESNKVKLLQYTSRLNDYTKRWAEKLPQESLSKHQRVVMPSEGGDEKEDGFPAAIPVIVGSNQSKNIRAVKLPVQQNVPPYTTWIYIDRNQRMTEDQSVQGRRRIYYDPVGNETLIASDSEEEEIEEEEVKHEFSKGEDYVIWMTIQECGVDERAFEHISEALDVNCDEVQARYVMMATDGDKQAEFEAHGKDIHTKVIISPSGRRKVTRDQGRTTFKQAPGGLEAELPHKHGEAGQPGKSDEKKENMKAKDLVAAMDSFDNLFCRRCLVFDCRLHGCSQPLVHPSERQPPLATPDADSLEPCGRYCYKLIRKASTTQASTSLSRASSSSKLCGTSSSMDDFEKERATKRQRILEEEPSWSVDMEVDSRDEIVSPVGETALKRQTESSVCADPELTDESLAEAGKEFVENGHAPDSPKGTTKLVVTVNSVKKLARSLSRKGTDEKGLLNGSSLGVKKDRNAADKRVGNSELESEDESSRTEKRTEKAAKIAAEFHRVHDTAVASEDDVVFLYETTKRSQKKQSRITAPSNGHDINQVQNGLSEQLQLKLKFVELENGEPKALNGCRDSREKISEKTVCEISTYASQVLNIQHQLPTDDSKRKEDRCSKDKDSRKGSGKLARKLRKSTEVLPDSVEINPSQIEAGNSRDVQPQKEEKTRKTASQKLARSSRNSIVQNFSAQHQRVLMQMEQKREAEEKDEINQQEMASTRVNKSQNLGLITIDQSHVANTSTDGDGASIPTESKRLGKHGRPPDTCKPKRAERRQDGTPVKPLSVIDVSEEFSESHVAETSSVDNWTPLEKGLYEKGLQIFGRSSCTLARTILKGCKTCAEIADYINAHEKAAVRAVEAGSRQFADSLGCVTDWDNEIKRARAKFFGKKKGSRRLKFTLKSAGQSAVRKRLNNGKDLVCRQYTPCGCLFSCGKQCPCQLNGTCCEKYCGCAKSCKNRFRGCHCAKSQCCSRQCPCFAAGRECDPDVCRNCWIGCGDGKLVYPQQPEEKEQYTCHNMKLLLKQQQRVLLSRSDVAGWGAFLRNTVNKHEYLGEYTGELISHREADKRGKIYDRENSSFLFNLNDQYVLDACRKGDKLKFANHSPSPNCYAKVIMVAGDHRVGIFAKERIMAGEELFYDYRYEADRAPTWAKRNDDVANGKKEDTGSSSGRGTKQAS
ncbi:hypothetical protein R1sor_003347 [Riccia sorocarpa]|uniref:[Histone H3]-lysine(27) N-trimethyltransferase n=1 Tax=Riccia sorocarpa TaxID=122646 RepID=A0ABD3H4P7_9MARC